jgi:uncharacterized phage infection (PIP) family protein YhgE
MGATSSIDILGEGNGIAANLQALHELNLSIAHQSWIPLKLLPHISDEQVKLLCNKLLAEEGSSDAMIQELDVLQNYLSRLNDGLKKMPQQEQKQQAPALAGSEDNDHLQSKITNQHSESESKTQQDKKASTSNEHLPFCVSLEFLIQFTKDRPQSTNMTTGEVVYNIIIPETKASQLTYVEDKLVDKYPQYYRRMQKG